VDGEGALAIEPADHEVAIRATRTNFELRKEDRMTKTVSWTMAVLGAAALAVGVLLATGALTSAQSPTPTPSTNGSTFKSNEDPAHESKESAEWEAQEDAGQVPWGAGHGFKSNEDPAHESKESAEREAQEDAGQAQSPSSSAPY